MVRPLSLSQACEGFIHYKKATGLSPHTILDYQTTLKKLHGFFKDNPPLVSLGREKLVVFFAWLQDGYLSEPDGVAPRGKIKLAPKSIANIHANLSSFWSWAAQEGFVPANVIRTIARPPFTPPVIEPLSKEGVAILLKACDSSRTWKTRPDVANRRPSADRDRAIILTLLDTGVRASELCGIRFGDLSLGQKSLKVRGKGPGTEGKQRIVFFGKRTGQAIWRCLAGRLDSMRPEDPVFTVGSPADPRPLTAPVLRKLLDRIGDKASVPNVYPHRFRHTFAITYLRNQGDIFTLQSLLGHSDLAMVRRYARVAQADCAEVHRRASPVDNWRL
jgi:integrase/recombinase XerD